MKVKIFNRSPVTQFIDLTGTNDPDGIVVLGSKANTEVELPSETRYVALAKKFNGVLVLRKL